jgi:hypothetical protein
MEPQCNGTWRLVTTWLVLASAAAQGCKDEGLVARVPTPDQATVFETPIAQPPGGDPTGLVRPANDDPAGEEDPQPPAPDPAAGELPGDQGAPPDPVPAEGSVAGIEFLRRIVGTWTGINSNTPIGFDFPMTVDFAPNGDSFVFGKFDIDAQNNVLWGFNIENYDGTDVLAYRNGGYLGGLLRDSRTKLVEHDAALGFYRFCAVKEMGIAVDGCAYIDARYTFSAPDKMLFEVTTRSGKAHVHWEATRTAEHALPEDFPASVESQGDGSAPWPAEAGISR